MATSTSGGTSSITFSVPTVGDISCGGGGCGTYNGGAASNAPTNGGSGGGAGADTTRGYSGGAGVFNGGSGFSSASYGSCTVGGGGYGTAGNNIGDGAGSLGPYSGRTYANGGQGAIIIAVPA